MVQRLIIAGGREFDDYQHMQLAAENTLRILGWHRPTIISGAAKGADSLGERYAKEKNYPIQQYPADWNTYGKAAGPIRNREMANNAEALLCFWDGKSRGTKSMIDLARKQGLIVNVQNYY